MWLCSLSCAEMALTLGTHRSALAHTFSAMLCFQLELLLYFLSVLNSCWGSAVVILFVGSGALSFLIVSCRRCVLSVIFHCYFSEGQGSLCEAAVRSCKDMQLVSKQAEGCTCGRFANAKEHEFVFQPKCGSFGQLKPEALAGSLTAGNYVNSGSLTQAVLSCLREQDEEWKYVRDM